MQRKDFIKTFELSKMRFIKTLFTLSILIYAQNIFACDCDNQGEFLTVAPQTDMVALIKVTRYLSVNFKDVYGKFIPQAMEAEIITVYKGKETRKTIIVWGDNGAQCRPYLSVFGVGEYFVIAFNKNSRDTSTKDYYISNCGTYWLNVDKKLENAHGAVSKKQDKIQLVDLKAKLGN